MMAAYFLTLGSTNCIFSVAFIRSLSQSSIKLCLISVCWSDEGRTFAYFLLNYLCFGNLDIWKKFWEKWFGFCFLTIHLPFSRDCLWVSFPSRLDFIFWTRCVVGLAAFSWYLISFFWCAPAVLSYCDFHPWLFVYLVSLSFINLPSS